MQPHFAFLYPLVNAYDASAYAQINWQVSGCPSYEFIYGSRTSWRYVPNLNCQCSHHRGWRFKWRSPLLCWWGSSSRQRGLWDAWEFCHGHVAPRLPIRLQRADRALHLWLRIGGGRRLLHWKMWWGGPFLSWMCLLLQGSVCCLWGHAVSVLAR